MHFLINERWLLMQHLLGNPFKRYICFVCDTKGGISINRQRAYSYGYCINNKKNITSCLFYYPRSSIIIISMLLNLMLIFCLSDHEMTSSLRRLKVLVPTSRFLCHVIFVAASDCIQLRDSRVLLECISLKSRFS